MDYSGFGVIAIKGIQELQQTINDQQQTINDQQQTINDQQQTINDQQQTINDQQQTINDQQQTINDQQQTITELKERISKLETTLAAITGDENLESNTAKEAVLEQNQPNPFNQNTVIRYRLPQGMWGQINLYNANGVLVKTFTANETGEAQISANELKAGTYTYTLLVNRKVAASKKLGLLK